MLVAVAGLAVAAPVPKEKAKLEDVFGEVADKKSECKFEMNKDGALAVTVPTTHPALEPDAHSTVPPMVGKKVTGDFVLTVRVTLALPKADEVKVGSLPPAVMAGVSVVSADSPSVGARCGTVRRLKGDEWKVANLHTSRKPLPPGGPGPFEINKMDVEAKGKPGDPTWLRVTRRGALVEVDTSGDGTSWVPFSVFKEKSWGETVSVGPVAFGCIDKEFSVTFDQYEIKPLKEEKK